MKWESWRPSAATCAFMAPTNRSVPTVPLAMALAASLPLTSSIPVSSSLMVSVWPAARPMRLSSQPRWTASGVTGTVCDGGKFSKATSAVSTLAVLAGARCRCASLSQRMVFEVDVDKDAPAHGERGKRGGGGPGREVHGHGHQPHPVPRRTWEVGWGVGRRMDAD